MDRSLNTSGGARTPNPRFRSLRRIDFATPAEIVKSTLSRCRTTTSKSISGFAAVVSFTVQRREKGTDLRNPQIQSQTQTPPTRSHEMPWGEPRMANTAGGPTFGGRQEEPQFAATPASFSMGVAEHLWVNISTDNLFPQRRRSSFPMKAGWQSNGFAAKS